MNNNWKVIRKYKNICSVDECIRNIIRIHLEPEVKIKEKSSVVYGRRKQENE